MLQIHIKTIPHDEQRYDTTGDYWQDDKTTEFRITAQDNPDYEFLVALHELVEWYLTQKRGIRIEEIDAFDMGFEKEREKGLHEDWEEPGDDANAPYRKEHRFASIVEQLVCHELGIDWQEYEESLE